MGRWAEGGGAAEADEGSVGQGVREVCGGREVPVVGGFGGCRCLGIDGEGVRGHQEKGECV